MHTSPSGSVPRGHAALKEGPLGLEAAACVPTRTMWSGRAASTASAARSARRSATFKTGDTGR